jgi:hypothetical protein
MSEIRANSITDAAGTGAPNFPNGLTSGGVPVVPGTQSFTASGSITAGDFVGINSNGTVSKAGTSTNPALPSYTYSTTQRNVNTIGRSFIVGPNNAGGTNIGGPNTGTIALSNTTFAGAYFGSGAIVARVTTVAADGSATFGADFTAVASGVTAVQKIVRAGSNSFAIFYQTAATNIFVIAGQVSGTTITFGSPTLVQSGLTQGMYDVISNNNGTIVCAWNTTQTNTPLLVSAVSVSGTTATAGSSTVLRNTAPSYQAGCLAYDPVGDVYMLNATQITTPWTNWSWAIRVSGTTLSIGSQQNVFGSQWTYGDMCRVIYDVSAGRFVARAPYVTSGQTDARYYTATISSLTITASAQTTSTSGAEGPRMIAAPDGSTLVYGNGSRITYDPLNSYKPTITALPQPISVPLGDSTLLGSSGLYARQQNVTNTLGFTDQQVFIYGFSDIASAIGTATQTVTNGQPVTVAVSGGVGTGFSGLTTGAIYYSNPSGVPALSGTVKFGNATSATSILIGPTFV